MSNQVRCIPLKEVYCSLRLSGNRLIAGGEKFIRIFSLETGAELKNFDSNENSFEIAATSDEKFIFVATSDGIKQFSLPDVSLINTHLIDSKVFSLCLLEKFNQLIIGSMREFRRMDLSTFFVNKFELEKDFDVTKVSSLSSQFYFFTTGSDNVIRKWSSGSWKIVKKLKMEYTVGALLPCEERGTLIVGFEDGNVSEYSLEDLVLQNSVSLHKSWVGEIICLLNKELVSCSDDGFLMFPFSSRQPIKVSDQPISSITNFDSNLLSCSCDDGIKIIEIAPRSPDPPSSEEPVIQTINAISSSLNSIRFSSSDKEPQVVSLLQHHLTQLLSKAKPQPKSFSGLAISLLPDLNNALRIHLHQGSPESKRKIFNKDYILEMASQTSTTEASLVLFERRIRISGKIENENHPLEGFKIKEFRKGKWVFVFDREIPLTKNDLKSAATVNFSNGWLKCYTIEGLIAATQDFKAKINISGVTKDVSSISYDGVVLTTDRKIFTLNFESNTIVE